MQQKCTTNSTMSITQRCCNNNNNPDKQKTNVAIEILGKLILQIKISEAEWVMPKKLQQYKVRGGERKIMKFKCNKN